MRKLLTKTLTSFTLYSLIVLAASVPAYYYLVDSIWLNELDEHNTIIADRTANELDSLKISDHELSEAILLWNKVQPGTMLAPTNKIKPDSFYTINRLNKYRTDNEIDRFRGLKRTFLLNGKPYELSIETNVEETEETAVAIAKITIVFFLVLVIGFLLINRILSVTLWKPFRNTLEKIKAFNLHSQSKVYFDASSTVEFEELNDALNKLIDHNIATYTIQKEFTENASHELQTPLAVIKNKLDLLLQTQSLTERQYQLIEEINKALTRTSRTNRNLLLLARIENQQFDNLEKIDMSELLQQSLHELSQYALQKELTFSTSTGGDIAKIGNRVLVEMLINNLILNAIRHTDNKGIIVVNLTKEKLLVANSGNQPLNSDSLFKRFARVSGESAGSGLGLAIIREICNSHRWQIDYEFSGNLHVFVIRF